MNNGNLNTVPTYDAAGLYADQTMIMDMQAAGQSATSLGLTPSQVSAVENGSAQIVWSAPSKN